jgi:hypothetical protein
MRKTLCFVLGGCSVAVLLGLVFRNQSAESRLGNRSGGRQNAPVYSNAAAVTKHDPHAFSRPEDRGDDLSQLDKEELLKRLSQSTDVVELRKVAKVLGDRNIAGAVTLSGQDKVVVSNIVQHALQQSNAKNAQERVEARQQIERLWWVAAPGLLDNIDTREPAVAETIIKSLVLMRNDDIVHRLITTASTAPSLETRSLAIFALGKMTEKRESLIPGRICMNEEQSKELAEKMIIPFFRKITQTETNADVRGSIARAVKDLESAVDRRLIPEAEFRRDGSSL